MPRITAIVCLLLLALPGLCAAAGGAAPLAVPRAIDSPTLDGQLDDWPARPLLEMDDASAWFSQSGEYGGPEDISAEARLMWDNTNLYVAIKTRDDKLVRVPSAGEIDKVGDSIVLGLGAEGAPESNEFAITLLSSGSPRIFRTEPAAKAGVMKTVSCLVDPHPDEGGGWQVVYELAIPWSELAGLRPLAGERVKLTVAASDDDGEGLKGFLEQSASVQLTASASPVAGGPTPPPTARAALPATFLAPNAIRFDGRRFFVKGQEALLYGGEIDYTRLPRGAWANRLADLKAVGMNLVGLSVPWNHYQPTAAALANLDELRAFLDAVAKAGLWAQVNVGPFAEEREECGGLPAWYLRLDGAARQRAADEWMSALLSVLKEYQISSSGPVISVVGRTVPEATGWIDAASLANLTTGLRKSGLMIPQLTANAPAARDNSRQTLANLLDTISFYTAPSFGEIETAILGLAQEENGPSVISSLPGAYGGEESARHSADAIRVALANGATEVVVSDFAVGTDTDVVLHPGTARTAGVVRPTGAQTPGYEELRLLGSFLRLCGSQLARAVPAEGALRADDPEVKTALRLTDREGFIFLWNGGAKGPRQVRLTYSEPGTTSVIDIPAAGAITVPASGAKILPLDLPVGRGTLRFSTSEVAALHQVGDRTLLVLYGEQDTPGEICLRWPGPPLVLGKVLRQDWDAAHKCLILDYYHKAQDQYLLVDNLQIVILSRERAAAAAQGGDAEQVMLSAGLQVAQAEESEAGLRAALRVPTGQVTLTAALPAAPAQVLLDGKPAPFTFSTPERVLEMTVNTDTFEQERKPDTVWQKVSQTVLGGPPKLLAAFDRAQFQAESDAPKTTWAHVGQLGRTPEALGVHVGDFARFRTRIDPGGRTKLVLAGATDPTVVFVNGKPVAFADDAPEREADIAPLLTAGENELTLLVQLLPRPTGLAALRAPEKRLPVVVLKGEAGELVPDEWEAAPGLAGEAAGWTDPKADDSLWSVLKLGAWHDQGRRFENVTGVGWYRVQFDLPKPEGWHVPYVLRVGITGNAQLYLNGTKLGALLGTGEYRIPLPDPPLVQGGENVLVAAIYDPAGAGGLTKVEIVGDTTRMTRARQLEIVY